MSSGKTLEERKKDFILRLNRLYPDYRLITDYVNSNTFIELIHLPTNEIWKTKPRYLDGKRQAPGVAISLKSKNKIHQHTQESFEKLFYNKWDRNEYEIKGKYIKISEKIEILHKKCGRIFSPIANNMINNNKKGCTYCYGKSKKTIEEYNQLFQSNEELKNYKVLSIESRLGHVYGIVKHNCEKCSNYIFNIRLSDMLSKHKHRCPKCKFISNESRAVRDIKQILIENNIEFIQEKTFDTCKNINKLPFDFYIPSLNTIIEYDGEQHFKPSFISNIDIAKVKLEQIQKNDKIKNKWCKENNINLLRINYKQDHIKIIKKQLNL